MVKTIYRVVTVQEKKCLVSFTEDEGGEKSARAFARLALEANEKFRKACTVTPPAMKLEIEAIEITTIVNIRTIPI